ncbi:MAG: hypothetical protein Q7K26_00590, partial [bacterium]|nr:hypothetical protein [bacterium]
PVDDATKELATKVALQEVVKGEVTLLCLVDAFDCVPKLREFSSALRKYTLVGHYGSHFDNSVV